MPSELHTGTSGQEKNARVEPGRFLCTKTRRKGSPERDGGGLDRRWLLRILLDAK